MERESQGKRSLLARKWGTKLKWFEEVSFGLEDALGMGLFVKCL
jgi:hypothetical protein